MKIAVCDDCMKDALYLKGFLGGHEVRVYSDACNLFADMEDKKERYDLYLLDIYMEGPIDGIELAKKIRIWQEEAAICFVSSFLTRYRRTLSGAGRKNFLFNLEARREVSHMEKYYISVAGNIYFLFAVWTERYKSAKANWMKWQCRYAETYLCDATKVSLSICIMWIA